MQQKPSIYQALQRKEINLPYITKLVSAFDSNNPTTFNNSLFLKLLIQHIEFLEDMKIIRTVRRVHLQEKNYQAANYE